MKKTVAGSSSLDRPMPVGLVKKLVWARVAETASKGK
jgi:hypothetical protein